MSPGASGSFVRHSAVMSVGTTLSRATGFLRLSAMAYALGVAESRLADSYQVANTTPNIIYELALGGILSSVFVPVFVEWLQTRGREAAWHTAQAVLTFAMLFLGLVMVAGMIGAGTIVDLYTVQVAGPQREAMRALASFFLVFFMPQIVFYGLGAVATGLLNAHRRFSVPMFAPILNNVVVAATFLLFAALPGPAEPTPSGITTAQRYVLAVGTTLGVAAMTVALWPSLRKLGFRLRWTLDLRDAGLRRIGRLAGWAFTYVLINQVGFLVVIVFAGEVQGGVAAYTAAFILFQLPHAIFAVSIMTALLPSLSGFWAEGDRAAFRSQLAQGIRATAFIVVPASFGYLALAVPIVRVLLQHGVAQETSTTLVAGVLVAFSAGLFSFSAFQLFLRAFYAMQDTRTPALIKACTVGLNIALVLVLFPRLRVQGLALAHAIAYTVAAVAAAAILRRRLGGLEGRRLIASLARVAFAGCATGAAAYLASRWVENALGTEALPAQLLQVGAALAAGGAAFLGMSVLLRIEEMSVIRRLARARFAGFRDGS